MGHSRGTLGPDMHEHSQSLIQLLIILGAAVLFVPLSRRLGLGSIIGYLVAGMLIGPSVLGFVSDVDTIAYIAEFGVVFLLFLIGIEMKPKRLWTMRRLILGLGGTQILVTALFLALAAWYFGVTGAATIIIGLGLALSSTAMGLQMLTDRHELQTSTGRTSFSILLMQDLAVPVLLAVVAVLAGDRETVSPGLLVLGIVEGLAILLLAFLFSRYALKYVLAQVAAARVTEVFTTFALFLVLGMAWLMEYVGLSLAMGAFLAGVFLADSEYRHQIEADIQPFRGLLLGLFFMGIGMGIDLDLLLDLAPMVVGMAAGIMLFKGSLIVLFSRLFRLPWKDSLHSGVYLCQMGEFGFVLFAFAATQGVITSEQLAVLVLVIAVSMALTPFVVPAGIRLVDRFRERGARPTSDLGEIAAGTPEGGHSFIIAGYGRVGQTIVSQLAAAGYSYIRQ